MSQRAGPGGRRNRATQAQRQPGSAIKPLSYLAALGKGLQPDTLVMDEAITLPPVGGGRRGDHWTPKNYSGGGGGMLTLRKALESKLGASAGDTRLLKLYYGIMQRATDIPSSYAEALVADDDDGNLANGTPNQCEIDAAFALHGLSDPAVTLGLEPPVRDGYKLSINVRPQQQLPCPPPSVTGASVTWTPRGGGFGGEGLAGSREVGFQGGDALAQVGISRSRVAGLRQGRVGLRQRGFKFAHATGKVGISRRGGFGGKGGLEARNPLAQVGIGGRGIACGRAGRRHAHDHRPDASPRLGVRRCELGGRHGGRGVQMATVAARHRVDVVERAGGCDHDAARGQLVCR